MMNFSAPWEPKLTPNGLWQHKLRNDSLWQALVAERSQFVREATRWREDAHADGWSVRPTYASEHVDRAWTLERDGYKVLGISRPGSDKCLPTASINCWGPDGLAIMVGTAYDGDAIIRGARACARCSAIDVDTRRVGFAGRVCFTCHPAAQAEVERPGWDN